jgi:hypothetical protein
MMVVTLIKARIFVNTTIEYKVNKISKKVILALSLLSPRLVLFIEHPKLIL